VLSQDSKARDLRWLDIAGAVAIAIAIVGLIVARSLLLLWVFLLAFGLATVPERLYRRVRSRGQR
jgi:hypothetical protein